jgi:hypothetical protein
MRKRYLILSALIAMLTPFCAFAQLDEHMLGVKVSYNLSGINITPKAAVSSINTKNNFSLVYTYYHDLWKGMPYSGFQAALSYEEQGFMLDGERYDYTLVKLPLVSQFHIDFWKMRLLVNLGGYAGYRLKSSSGFGEDDYRIDYGFLAGTGLAFALKPMELHIEGNYHHSFSNLYNPKRDSDTDLVFTNPYQILLSVAIYIHL